MLLLRHWKKITRYQVPEIINHPYHYHQLTSSSSSSSRSLLLVVVGVQWWWLLLLIVVVVALGIYVSLLFLLSVLNST